MVWRSLKGSGYLGCCQRQRLHDLFYACGWVGSRLEFSGVLRLWMKLSTGGNQWFSTVARALDFLSEVHPNRVALQPCLDGPARKANHGDLTDLLALE